MSSEQTIDPCEKEYNIRLPNLELRYVNVKSSLLPTTIDDSKLQVRWYNVGNNTLPYTGPPVGRCGTQFPIYSNGT